VREGDLDTAESEYRRAAELRVATGRAVAPSEIRIGLAEIARARGDLGAAADLLGDAPPSTQASGFVDDWAEARLLTALGRLAEATGDAAEAARRHRQALEVARAAPAASDLAEVAEGLAGVALLGGAPERAALLLGAAVAVRGLAVTGDLHVAAVAAGARDLLGAQAFAEAYARGAAMGHEEALTTVEAAAG
jgi:hypothetical protein